MQSLFDSIMSERYLTRCTAPKPVRYLTIETRLAARFPFTTHTQSVFKIIALPINHIAKIKVENTRSE